MSNVLLLYPTKLKYKNVHIFIISYPTGLILGTIRYLIVGLFTLFFFQSLCQTLHSIAASLM